jgi:iron complex transport system substrate-binding protein
MNRRDLVVAALWGAAAAACSRGGQSHVVGEARRVVSVTPATTEALFAVGAGELVVGRTRFCDYPPEAGRVPAVGGFVDLDLEAILERAPDLVVGASGPASGRLAAQLESRGIPSWFPELVSCDAILAMIEGLGDRTAHGEGGRSAVRQIRAALSSVDRALGDLRRPRVVLLLALAPAVAAGPRSFLDELLGRARAQNGVSSGPAWQTVGLEELAELDPDLVLDATASPGSPPGVDPAAPGWQSVRAVQEGRVVAVGDSRVLRPGPRVAEGLAILARAVHPSAPLR